MTDNVLPYISTHYFAQQPVRLLERITTGLINQTYLIEAIEKRFILQIINAHVFAHPTDIDYNLRLLNRHLQETHSDYQLTTPMSDNNGTTLHELEDGSFIRLFDYWEDSVTLLAVATPQQAYQAARQFAEFTATFEDFDSNQLHAIIPDFHNLTLRMSQFESALSSNRVDRARLCQEAIDCVNSNRHIHERFKAIQNDDVAYPYRVIHHDTKISNVLFDQQNQGLAVIDLDTVMKGKIFSDIGDMMRTYLCPYTEEERALLNIYVRQDIFTAIKDGYLDGIQHILTPEEKTIFYDAGCILIYMQAIRFLTDYLNGDVYYPVNSPEHNLHRAMNQFTLLTRYMNTFGK